jgi:hypothetical protein
MQMSSLTPKEKNRIMKELLDKYNKETLEKQDGKKLKILLQEKQDEAFTSGDKILAIGLGFLIAGLIGYLALKH